MKKNRLGKVFVTAVVALSMICTSFIFASADTGAKTYAETTVKAASQSSVISWSKGMSIFRNRLEDRGVSSAVIKYLHLTRDDGYRVYKGKAVKGNYVYSIEINAVTGKIRDYERDYEGSAYTASKVGAVSKTTITNKIKSKVPGCYVIYAKLTRDDGRYVWEAEAYKGGYEYDFEYTKGGTLIEWDKDKV